MTNSSECSRQAECQDDHADDNSQPQLIAERSQEIVPIEGSSTWLPDHYAGTKILKNMFKKFYITSITNGWRKLTWLNIHDNRSNNIAVNMGPQTSPVLCNLFSKLNIAESNEHYADMNFMY
ncbi:hypothetical protein L9F63_016464, partial [Diploptera punctata]